MCTSSDTPHKCVCNAVYKGSNFANIWLLAERPFRSRIRNKCSLQPNCVRLRSVESVAEFPASMPMSTAYDGSSARCSLQCDPVLYRRVSFPTVKSCTGFFSTIPPVNWCTAMGVIGDRQLVYGGRRPSIGVRHPTAHNGLPPWGLLPIWGHRCRNVRQ